MGVFGRIFKRNDVSHFPNKDLIEAAINIYLNYEAYDEVWDEIKKLTPSKSMVVMLYAFIPEVFCQFYLPDVHHSPYYIIHGENNDREYELKSNGVYNEIYLLILNNWQQYKDTADILKVAGTSAKFHSINNLLLQNPSTQINEIITSPLVIINP